MAGLDSDRSLVTDLVSALFVVPLQACITMLFLALVYWAGATVLGGRGPFGLALRACAYTLGVMGVLVAPLNLLLGVDTGLGFVVSYSVGLILLVIQWRVFKAVAESGFKLPARRSTTAASVPYVVIVAILIFFAVVVTILSI
ncbi:hypothetical protein [Leptolyngbya sp. FACHB-16]|uniref:hypothetical protein n=1 Tax=unclassified Leptolyngbya TaxID=2650499 RepID=UPI0016846DF8|nr:hypothetical protein [Leptolyngbya sp. FACHB-16]MBD2156172.1 hypothetical protein [Leptolyngbya sp. FACHB-16]